MASDELEGVPEPGELLDGKYRIERVLGVGGMGVVVEATHLHLGEQVAIKFLTGEAAKDEERVARFTREAWAAAKIKSDHVARVSDVARSDDFVYLVMEFLEGGDLEGAHKGGPMPVQQAVDYLLQACEALAEAHKLGIVHRDLKPGNLFVTHRADGSPWIKVLDFGISKFTGGADSMTKTSTLMGSPLYMAPEQLTSAKHVDGRADIWALGVILFELITATSPFDGDTLPQVCTNVLSKPPRSIHEIVAQLPVDLDVVVKRALAKDPVQRYQSLAELAAALVPFGSPAASASAEFVAKVLGAPAAIATSSAGVRAAGVTGTGEHAVAASGGVRGTGEPVAMAATEHGVAPTPAPSQPGVDGAPAGLVAAPPSAAPQVGAVTAAPVSTSLGPSRRSAPLVAALVGGALVVVLVVVGIVLTSGEDQPTAETRPPAAIEAPAPDESDEPDEPDEPDELIDEPAGTATSSAEPATTASASVAPADSASPKVAPKVKRPWTPPPKPSEKKWDPYKKR